MTSLTACSKGLKPSKIASLGVIRGGEIFTVQSKFQRP
jgi:hypothetical protein